MTKETTEKRSSEGEKSFVIYKVIRTIITSGVIPLPRNYELFYEMLSGQNKALARDLLKLPHNPDQKLLDRMGEKYDLPGFSNIKAKINATHHSDLLAKLNVRLLKSVKQAEAIFQVCSELKEPAPTLLKALQELRKEQHDLQNFINDEASKILIPDTHDDSIAPIATRDILTGLPNRLLFTEKMSELFQDPNNLSHASLILCNIDHLRVHNDKFGMSEVNKGICRLALMLKRRVKSHDFVARISGNEFAIIISNVPQSTAVHIAERLRTSAHKIHLGPVTRFTLSIGVADSSQTTNPQEFFAKADLSLLASRTGKRDCVTAYDHDVAMRSRQAYLMHLKAENRASRTLA